jgi:hypothetical protein
MDNKEDRGNIGIGTSGYCGYHGVLKIISHSLDSIALVNSR